MNFLCNYADTMVSENKLFLYHNMIMKHNNKLLILSSRGQHVSRRENILNYSQNILTTNVTLLKDAVHVA